MSLRATFNMLQYADHVSKAVHWSDGGAEFIFMDGTVMCFMDDMTTAVAVHASHPTRRDTMLVSLCLTEYEGKVKAALAVYNRFATRPRLVHGLCAQPEHVWSKASPVESLVLVKDRSLFSREYIRSSAALQQISDDANVPPYAASITCAMRKVTLTIHPSQEGFTVRWPARVSESDGSTSIFITPINERGDYAYTTPSQRACRYVMLEQWHWVDACPVEWRPMLDLCNEMDRDVPHSWLADARTDGHTSQHAVSEASQQQFVTLSIQTPEPLGAPRIPTGMSSYLVDKQQDALQARSSYVPPPPTVRIRFSDVQHDDAHSFIAATQVHQCPPQRKLHASTARIVWRWDSDPSGHVPSASYHCFVSQSLNGGGLQERCVALIHEDEAVVVGTHRCAPQTAAIVDISSKRVVRLNDYSATTTVSLASEGGMTALEVREYVQDQALSIALPRTVNNGRAAPILGDLAALLLAGKGGDVSSTSRLSLASSAAHQPVSPFTVAEEFGRYLPSVSESIVSLIGRCLSSSSASAPAQQRLVTSMTNMTAPEATKPDRAIKLTTRVDGVGTFTAMTNGVCRALFDDRVIVSLIPDASDSEDGLVCEMRGKDGEIRVMRVSQVMSTHEAYEYLTYLLPFRNFARMDVEDQRQLALVMPHQQHYAPTPIFSSPQPQYDYAAPLHQSTQPWQYDTTTNKTSSVTHDRLHTSSAAHVSHDISRQGVVQSTSPLPLRTPPHSHQVSSIDLLLMRSGDSISRSEIACAEAQAFLRRF